MQDITIGIHHPRSDIADFIRISRTGDWKLHLYAISKMTNLYAATGHINYAKSARIYLQLMLDHENTNPRLHQNFSEDLFVVQQSDQIWGGLWPDLAIEQIMTKPIEKHSWTNTWEWIFRKLCVLCVSTLCVPQLIVMMHCLH